MTRLFGGERRELKTYIQKDAKTKDPKDYKPGDIGVWYRSGIVSQEVKDNLRNVLRHDGGGSLTERALREIHNKNPLTPNKRDVILTGEELARFLTVEESLLGHDIYPEGTGTMGQGLGDVIDVLPKLSKDIYRAKSQIIKLKGIVAKIANSQKSQKAKDFLMGEINNKIKSWESEIFPLLSREYKNTRRSKDLPEFLIADIVNDNDYLEAAKQGFVLWNMKNEFKPDKRVSGGVDITKAVNRIEKKYKKDYYNLYHHHGLDKYVTKTLYNNDKIQGLLEIKKIEDIEAQVEIDLLHGFKSYGPGFLFEYAWKDFSLANRGVGVFKGKALPLYQKPSTNYRRIIRFLVKLRNRQIEGSENIQEDRLVSVDKMIRDLARYDYTWSNYFKAKSFIEDIPFEDIKLFHKQRSMVPDWDHRLYSMFQNYSALKVDRKINSSTPFGMGKEYDQHMLFYRELLTQAGHDKSDIEASVKVLSYIHQLEIENGYMHPFKYLSLMSTLPEKLRPAIDAIYPAHVDSRQGVQPITTGQIMSNNVHTMLGGGAWNNSGLSFNPGIGANSYSYKIIKRLLSQAEDIRGNQGNEHVKTAFRKLKNNINEGKESEDTKNRKKNCKIP